MAAHREMLLDVVEWERLSCTPGKLTAIMASSQAPVSMLSWSLLSLLENTPPALLEHIFVVLNGPRPGEAGSELQDEKQQFLNELDQVSWHGRPVPLTVMRLWGHIGHAESIESALPWVWTEFYLALHDDVILRSPEWTVELDRWFLRDERVALATVGPHLAGRLSQVQHQKQGKLGLPHLQSHFVVCRKPILTALGRRWRGYHVQRQFRLEDEPFGRELILHHCTRNQIDPNHVPRLDAEYGFCNVDIGGWILQAVQEADYRIANLPANLVHHFTAASWSGPPRMQQMLEHGQAEVAAFEAKLKQSKSMPGAWSFYESWKERTAAVCDRRQPT